MAKDERLLKKIEELTAEMVLKNNLKDSCADATNLSIDLHNDRSNISRKLNQLFRMNYLIKVNGRPTLYFSRKVLEETTKISHIPANFSSVAEFEYFLYNDHSEKLYVEDFTDLLKKVIGSGKNETLSETYRQLCLIHHYPNHKMNLLLEGERGTGKHFLLSTFEKTIRDSLKFVKEAQTIILDVYSNDEEKLNYLVQTLSLTSKDKVHLVSIEHLHVLSIANLEYFLNLILSLQTESKYLVQFVVTSETLSLEKKNLVKKYLPNCIRIPTFDERTLKEKMMFILNFLQQECDSLNQSFCVSKNILTCLLISSYKNNLTDLRNEIMYACANAYYNFTCFPTNSSMIDLQFSDLSDDLLNNIPDVTGEAERVKTVFKIIGESDLYFLVNIPQQSLALLESTRVETNLHLVSDQNIERRMTELVQQTLLSKEKSFVINNQNFDSRLFDFTNDILESFSIHIEKKLIQLLVHSIRQFRNSRSKKEYLLDFQRNNPVIDQAANTITEYLKDNYTNEKLDFFNSYIYCFLSMTNRYALDNVVVVFISQVEHVASSYKSFFAKKYSQLHFLSFYMENAYLDLTQESLLHYQTEILKQSKAAKIILITDIELLKQSGKQLFNKLPRLQIHYPLSLIKVEETCSLLLNTSKKVSNENNAASEKLSSKALLEYLNNSLIFLNPEKAFTLLTQVLTSICQKLDIDIDDELTLHFVNHAAFMVERTIRNETLPYKSKKESTEEYARIYQVVKTELELLNNVFAITIPQNELAFTSEIFYKYFV
ncbi:PRD domain-containing protein [Enterococcus sp. 669A]|uniref:PRD domain-containing protein n=1 Tax=Candidatus Enterococcus moelleringii TaxID=2815325 RepID=A0ABS3LEM6_9ENTE|nr:PRD domain-containing protein [Enterococcus sp. 669A]MBO1308096.1 PRD domain-containing protein [Enterococcus sp. 669A]